MDTPKGYTEDCVPECFEFGGDTGCPGWTHPGQDRRKGPRSFEGNFGPLDPNDIHADFDWSNPAPPLQPWPEQQQCMPDPEPTGEPAFVRSRIKPKQVMGVVEGGNLPLELLQRMAKRWGGMVVIPRKDD